MISGKRLSGEEAPFPGDWRFTEQHMTVAVESRPDDPHSVTTLCFVHEGNLIIPAQSGSTRAWPSYVVNDPRVRVKVGEHIYLASAERILDADPGAVRVSIAKKYERFMDLDAADEPVDVWLFRLKPRS